MVQRVAAEERKGITRITRRPVISDSSRLGCHARTLTLALTRASPKDPAAPARRRPARGSRYDMLSSSGYHISRRVKAIVLGSNESSQGRDCYLGGPQESRPALERRAGLGQEGVQGIALWRLRFPRPIHPTVSESPYHGPELDGTRAVFCGRNGQWSPGLGILGGNNAGGGSTVTVFCQSNSSLIKGMGR